MAMRVELVFFSILRHCLPPDADGYEAAVEVAENTTLGDLLSRFGVHRRLGVESSDLIVETGWQVLVNGRFEPNVERVLEHSDRIAIFPPMAGG
jgi:sulfur carrier protein ThiS